jgi:hypothetical protein
MRRARVAAVLALAALPGLARAQEAAPDPRVVQPERPTVATHAGTVAPSYLELESGLELDRLHGAHTLTTPTLLKVGIARRLQLDLAGTFVHTSGTLPTESGAGDASIGFKWRLADHLPVLGRFAVQPTLKFPTGSARRGTGTGTTDGGLLLISSHEFGPLALDVNVGYTRRSGDGSAAPRSATFWTVSTGWAVAGPLGWATEIFGLPATSGPAGQRSTVALLAGPTAQPCRWLALDLGLIVPLAGPQPHAFYTGLVWNLGRL